MKWLRTFLAGTRSTGKTECRRTDWKSYGDRHANAEAGGGEERRKQHAEGKLSARERIDLCSTKAPLKSWTSWSAIAAATSVWRSRSSTATALSPDTD